MLSKCRVTCIMLRLRDGAGKAQLIEHAQRPPIVRQGMRVKVAIPASRAMNAK